MPEKYSITQEDVENIEESLRRLEEIVMRTDSEFWKLLLKFMENPYTADEIFYCSQRLKQFLQHKINYPRYKQIGEPVVKPFTQKKRPRFKSFSRETFAKTHDFDTEDKIDKRVRSGSTEVLKERQEIILDEVYKYLEEKGYI